MESGKFSHHKNPSALWILFYVIYLYLCNGTSGDLASYLAPALLVNSEQIPSKFASLGHADSNIHRNIVQHSQKCSWNIKMWRGMFLAKLKITQEICWRDFSWICRVNEGQACIKLLRKPLDTLLNFTNFTFPDISIKWEIVGKSLSFRLRLFCPPFSVGPSQQNYL